MKKTKVYIAGAMTGLPEFNYPAFHAAAAHLRALGYDVENPAEFPEQPNWDAYMRQAMKRLADCSEVFLLPGWEESKGARIERDFAEGVGMKVYYPGHQWHHPKEIHSVLNINFLEPDAKEKLLAALKEQSDFSDVHVVIEKTGFNFIEFVNKQHNFSQKTFGSGQRVAGVLDHIAKEVNEVRAEPGDIFEWCDIVILAIDGMLRQGFDADDIAQALSEKLEKNIRRQWPDWRTIPEGSAIEHIRSEEAEQ